MPLINHCRCGVYKLDPSCMHSHSHIAGIFKCEKGNILYDSVYLQYPVSRKSKT